MTPIVFISNPAPDLLVLGGDIDLHASPRVRDAASLMLERELPEFFIDLNGVTYMDSSGIAVLIEILQRVHGYGGRLSLFGMPQRLRTVFEIAQLDQVLDLYPDEATARANT